MNDEWLQDLVDSEPYDLELAVLVGEIPTAWDTYTDEQINNISESIG